MKRKEKKSMKIVKDDKPRSWRNMRGTKAKKGEK